MAAQLHAQRQPPWENLRTRATRMTPPASAPLRVSGAFPLLAGFHALAAWLQQSCVRLENRLGKQQMAACVSPQVAPLRELGDPRRAAWEHVGGTWRVGLSCHCCLLASPGSTFTRRQPGLRSPLHMSLYVTFGRTCTPQPCSCKDDPKPCP